MPFASVNGVTLGTVEVRAPALCPAAVAAGTVLPPAARCRFVLDEAAGTLVSVGRSPDADTLARLVALCVERQVWLVLDAVYLDVVAADSVPSPHALPGAKDVLVTVGSLSKSHRMSGWRIGWTVAPPALAEHFANLSVCMHYGLAPFVMDAARAALDGAADTPRFVREALAARRALACEALGDVSPARLVDSIATPLPEEERSNAIERFELLRPCTGLTRTQG